VGTRSKALRQGHVRKDLRLNIRLFRDARFWIASRVGRPYQTLISNPLHKYASGRFKEV
jgi:predicted DNA binding CopG/RHH family protein